MPARIAVFSRITGMTVRKWLARPSAGETSCCLRAQPIVSQLVETLGSVRSNFRRSARGRMTGLVRDLIEGNSFKLDPILPFAGLDVQAPDAAAACPAPVGGFIVATPIEQLFPPMGK